MTAETREFATEVALSLATCASFCDFAQIHEAVEYVLGHPVWTHEFDNKVWWAAADAVIAAEPRLERVRTLIAGIRATAELCPDPEAFWKAFVAEAVLQLGPTVRLVRGTAQRTETPVESLKRIAPNAQPIIIKVDR